MQIIDLAEQTLRLGQVAPALESARAEVETVRAGEIAKPVRELAPIAVRLHGLAMQYTEQLSVLSTSQYAAMKDGHQNLAELAEACTQVSFAATMRTFAIHRRTETLLYEDGDETPKTSRENLHSASEELVRAAKTFRRRAVRLSRRLASSAARHEDRQLIVRAFTDLGISPASVGATAASGAAALAPSALPSAETKPVPAPPSQLGSTPIRQR